MERIITVKKNHFAGSLRVTKLTEILTVYSISEGSWTGTFRREIKYATISSDYKSQEGDDLKSIEEWNVERPHIQSDSNENNHDQEQNQRLSQCALGSQEDWNESHDDLAEHYYGVPVIST